MARTVRDVALGYSILKGPDGSTAMRSMPGTLKPTASARRSADPRRLGLGRGFRARRSRDHRRGRRRRRASLPISDAKSRRWRCRSSAIPFATLTTLVYGEIVPSIKALAAGRESELHAVGAGIDRDAGSRLRRLRRRPCEGRGAEVRFRRLLPEVRRAADARSTR